MDTSTDCGGHSHLLDLPVELVEMIAEFVAPSSPALLHLRATCRDMRAKTERVVAREYFSDRTFFISHKDSLQVLLEISKHPVYAKSMQRISFSFATLRALPGNGEARKYFGNTTEVCLSLTPRETRSMRRERLQAYLRLLDEQAEFWRGNRARMLEDILTNFEGVGNAPALVATGERFRPNTFHTAASGYARLKRELGDDDCLVVDIEDKRPLNCLVDAIRRAGYTATHLELGCPRLGTPLWTFNYMDRSLPRLKTLRICMADMLWWGRWENVEARSLECRELLHKFAVFLRGATELETLAILCSVRNFFRNFSKHIFFGVYKAAVVSEADDHKTRGLQNLQVLELEGLEIDFPGLLHFVETMSKSLRSLKMRRSKLCRVTSWDVDVARKIRLTSGRGDFAVDIKGLKLRQRAVRGI